MTTGILFDLDGTLWDASESTARAWTEVFRMWGLPGLVTREQIRGVGGKPYLECLRLICPQALGLQDFDRLLVELSVAEQRWMEHLGGAFYPGAIEAVRELARQYPVFLVSNCNQWYLESFLRHSELGGVFSGAICYGTTGSPKADNIKCLIDKFGIRRGFYIGDTKGDMEASLAAGVRYVHAAFGFGGSLIPNSYFVLKGYDDLPDLCALIALS